MRTDEASRGDTYRGSANGTIAWTRGELILEPSPSPPHDAVSLGIPAGRGARAWE